MPFSHKARLVLNVFLTVLCLYFDGINDVLFFTDLKEDPHCVLMQSSRETHESVSKDTDDQNYNSDKTPNMEEKLQEVEKVRSTVESFYPRIGFLSWKKPHYNHNYNTQCYTLHCLE